MSDDSQEFKAAQSKHATKIATEWTIMDTTGCSRSQLRGLQGLRGFQLRVQEKQQERDKLAGVAPKHVPLKFTTQNFTPHRADAQMQKPGGNGAGGVSSDMIEDIIVIINGTAYYTNILTDGRLEAV